MTSAYKCVCGTKDECATKQAHSNWVLIFCEVAAFHKTAKLLPNMWHFIKYKVLPKQAIS